MAIRHFLDLNYLDQETLSHILKSAHEMKRAFKADFRAQQNLCGGKVMAMIFEKPSTRTRVSFDVAMGDLGGRTINLNRDEIQLGRGESVADTARVLSRYVDLVMIRTDDHQKLLDMAAFATIPIVNGLTDYSHPCQILADILTYEEKKGPIKGARVAWVGDGNNVSHSFIHAAPLLDFELVIAAPDELHPAKSVLDWAKDKKGRVELTDDPVAAVKGADLVVTDTWVSMGDEDKARRLKLLKPYQVNKILMGHAKDDALFMHCLPAYRGHEVSEEVLEGPQSAVWDEAENRLHIQKAILAWALEAI